MTMLLFAPAFSLNSVSKSVYADTKGVSENDVSDEETSEFWFDPQNVEDNLDDIYNSISDVTDGHLNLTKDNFRMILEKIKQYNSSVRTVDNAFRYYQHVYKISIAQVVPKDTETDSGDSGQSGGTSGSTDTGNGADAGGTQTGQADAGGQSASLPLPVRIICALFRPVVAYAEEIKVDIHNAAAAVMGDGTDGSGQEESKEEDQGEDTPGHLKWPVPGCTTVTSKFGKRNAPKEGASKDHKGIDISCPVGTQVIASEAGTVVKAEWQDPSNHGKGYGLEVVIQHVNGYYTRYAHLSSLKVSVGDTVTKGQVIALSGNSGNVTGAHLHFEVRQGVDSSAGAVDPSLFFDGSYDLKGPNEGMEDESGGGSGGSGDDPTYESDGVVSIAPASDPVRKEVDNGSTITYYDVIDYEDKLQIGHIRNLSPENDTFFRLTWEELFAMGAMYSLVQDSEQGTWETKTNLGGYDFETGEHKQIENFDKIFKKDDSTDTDDDAKLLTAVSRLDEQTINMLRDAFAYSIGYYFDPTSDDAMDGSEDTYAEHIYGYDEMDKYAYVLEESETPNVKHGEEVFPPGTSSFFYWKKKMPVCAPAVATNAYATVEYIYNENEDGTATLAGRQITFDGSKFYDYLKTYLQADYSMEWYTEFVKLLPGADYVAPGSTGSLSERMDMLYQSYKEGKPVSYFDDSVYGVGKITLGTRCSRTDLKYTERRDADGNVIGGGEDINLNITVEDITDEQIRADIAAGKYTLEDLVFTASCIQAEASTKEGQAAVAWCIRNRLPKYGSYRAVVTAPGQFASSWGKYLNGGYSSQAQAIAAAMLKGTLANPIGDCYYFFTASYCKTYKPGTYHITIGGNTFYREWGDVTSKYKEGYLPMDGK